MHTIKVWRCCLLESQNYQNQPTLD